MKKEGRQHGFVRTGMIHPPGFSPRPSNQFVNRLDSPLASGEFTKVPSKPTNHSNFTGKYKRSKYSNCHVLPAMKSADTSKGRQKLKSTDWWVDDKLDRLTRPDASSAKDILDTLCGDDYGGHVYDYENDC
ncbi:hypothetical protein Bca52824_092580 [Brassica carinata]|uniref:Uncharacterized protein n=1 Tax=Brassica carinata TaxID=52824 RepID=A0A8X7NUK1_BRACI|nr:hypothetical protein Bca52824_092580 [Brassica carinata]